MDVHDAVAQIGSHCWYACRLTNGATLNYEVPFFGVLFRKALKQDVIFDSVTSEFLQTRTPPERV